MTKLQKGVVLTLVSAVFNASTYLFSALILKKTSVETMLFLWFFWAVLLYFIFFAARTQVSKIVEIIRNRQLAIIGLVNAVSALLWSYGILLGGAALTAFIFRFEIVFTVLIGVIFLKEKISRLDILGIIIATVGAFLVAYRSSEIVIAATIIVLAAALISSLAIVLVKRQVKKTDPLILAASRSFYLFLTFSVLGEER